MTIEPDYSFPWQDKVICSGSLRVGPTLLCRGGRASPAVYPQVEVVYLDSLSDWTCSYSLVAQGR